MKYDVVDIDSRMVSGNIELLDSSNDNEVINALKKLGALGRFASLANISVCRDETGADLKGNS